MIHVIEGDGKGKTSAAVGLIIRAAGHGFKTLFIQFLKGNGSGEVRILRSIPDVEIVHCPVNYGFTFQMNEEQKRETAREYYKLIDYAISSDAFLIVLDEVIDALNAGLVEEKKIRQTLEKNSEIVLTGRDAPDWLVEIADYISEVKEIKHPYENGVRARVGIEF